MTVVASIFNVEDPWSFFTKGRRFDLPDWMLTDDYGRQIAEMVAQQHFDKAQWEEEFGDEDAVNVYVELHEPPFNESLFFVVVERATVARGTVASTDPRVVRGRVG